MVEHIHLERAKQARHYLTLSDHMLRVTYPVVNDPKILLAVTENIYLGLTNALASFLHYERLFKRVGPFRENPESMINFFALKCVEKYGFDESYVNVFHEIEEVLSAHESAAIEFTRKEKYVIANDNYKIKTLTLEKTKDLLARVKTIAEDFLKRAEATE